MDLKNRNFVKENNKRLTAIKTTSKDKSLSQQGAFKKVAHVVRICRINVLFEWHFLKMVFLLPEKGAETLGKNKKTNIEKWRERKTKNTDKIK